MDEITFAILKIVVSVCAALITAYVLPYLKSLKYDKRFEVLFDMITLAVKAAEQTIKGKGQGELKKETVANFISEWMDKNGMKITAEELDSLIESAVYQLKQGE